MKTIAVSSREVWRKVEVVGHGKVSDRHTSDLWIWEYTFLIHASLALYDLGGPWA